MNKKTVIILVIVGALLLCICVAVGVGAYLWYRQAGLSLPGVTPTATAEVFPTPEPLSVTDSLEEAFSNNTNQWSVGAFDRSLSSGTRTISNGVYTIDMTAKDGVFNYVYTDFPDIENFETNVDVKVLNATDDAGIGLMLKMSDPEDYRFVISPSTQEYVFKYDDGVSSSATKIIDWTESSLIHSTGYNTLKVTSIDGTFYLYINGTLVDSATDYSITNGNIALDVELYNAGDTATFVFDNFAINSYD